MSARLLLGPGTSETLDRLKLIRAAGDHPRGVIVSSSGVWGSMWDLVQQEGHWVRPVAAVRTEAAARLLLSAGYADLYMLDTEDTEHILRPHLQIPFEESEWNKPVKFGELLRGGLVGPANTAVARALGRAVQGGPAVRVAVMGVPPMNWHLADDWLALNPIYAAMAIVKDIETARLLAVQGHLDMMLMVDALRTLS